MTRATANLRGEMTECARDEAVLAKRCSEMAERAVAAGADEAEAYGTSARSIAVRFEKGDLKLAQVDDSSSLGLRVFRDLRMGFASTNQANEAAYADTARDALAIASYSPPHDANRLPGARPLDARASLVHPSITSLAVDQIVDLAADLVARAKSRDPRLSIDNASCELSQITHAIHSTRGVHACESDAVVALSIFGMAIDGADVGGFHYTSDQLRRASGIEAALAEIVDSFATVALGNLGAGASETYVGPVLFSPAALLSLFVAPLVSAASAIAVQRGRSALAGKLGQRIGAASLSIVDDASDADLAGCSTFDREGQPARRLAIVENGVLSSLLYNGYAAAVEGRDSTGHASGGTRSVPGLAPHALTVAGGNGGDRAALFAALGRGLYVERFSGSVDPASGDFSGVAKSARWVENGRAVRAVRETLLSGNVFTLLDRIVTLSSVPERVSGSARAPYAIVDALSVTAG